MWSIVFLILLFGNVQPKYLVMLFACACLVEGYSVYLKHQEELARVELVRESAQVYNETLNQTMEKLNDQYRNIRKTDE